VGVYFWAVFGKLHKNRKLLGHVFPQYKKGIDHENTWVGLHFERLFLQTHLVTLEANESRRSEELNELWHLFLASGSN
jgi:hypothetical protein